MEQADYSAWSDGQHSVWLHLQCDCNEAESDDWDHSKPQCFSSPSCIYFDQDMEQIRSENWIGCSTFHQASEYHDTDMYRCMLQYCCWRKQVKGFLHRFSFSFLWGFFKWFYVHCKDRLWFLTVSHFWTASMETNVQQNCSFCFFLASLHFLVVNVCSVGRFYFDFSLTYVGTGMICPHIVNLSLLLGAVLLHGMMWPLLLKLKGDWFPAEIPESGMKSLNCYKVDMTMKTRQEDRV